jgi:hypothetical protein
MAEKLAILPDGDGEPCLDALALDAHNLSIRIADTLELVIP